MWFHMLQKRNDSQVYGAVALRRKREMLAMVMVSRLSQKMRRRNFHGYLAFQEAAQERFQLRLQCSGFLRRRERELLVRIMLLLLSKMPQKSIVCLGYRVVALKEQRKRNFSQYYGVVAFPEAALEKFQLGLWCRSFPRSLEIEHLVRFIMSWLSKMLEREMLFMVMVYRLFKKPQKGNVRYGFRVVAFRKVTKKIFSQIIVWFLSQSREIKVRVVFSQLFYKSLKRNFN